MHLVGLYTYCGMMHGAYNVKLYSHRINMLQLKMNLKAAKTKDFKVIVIHPVVFSHELIINTAFKTNKF